MLIQFRVGNYLSFKDPVTFSMVASDGSSSNAEVDDNNLFIVDDELSLLKSAAIYGANASGKSNLIKAFNFMRWFVINSSKDTQAGETIDVANFKLCTKNTNEPSFFEVSFVIKKKIYRYGFKIDNKAVISEWLFYTPKQTEYKCFERSVSRFSISRKYFIEGEDINLKTRSNSLFLSTVAQFNGSLSEKILQWFRGLNIATINDLDSAQYYRYTIEHFNEDKYKNDILKLVTKLDLGIEDILLKESTDRHSINGQIFFVKTIKEVKTIHKLYEDTNKIDSTNSYNSTTRFIEFDLEEESDGTKKLFAFSGFIIHTLKTGQIFIVDELDARLHPLMTRAIIELFNSRETNPNKAQIIFTTHDTNILKSSLFRLDQIWFTEKNNLGATDLYSLAEFNIDRERDLEQDYIKGKYGAIPFIGNLRQLFS